MTDRTDPADQPEGTEPAAPRTPDPVSPPPSSAWPVWGATSSPRPSGGSPSQPDETPAPDESEPSADAPADAAEPDAAEPETAEPDAAEPETAEPDAAEPETAEPETAEPDAAEPETAEPETAEPDAAEPETAEPDAAERETAEPDAAEPETAEPDVAEPDVVEADTAEPDAVEPDVAEPDDAPPADGSDEADGPDEAPADGSDETAAETSSDAAAVETVDTAPAGDEPDETPADGPDEAPTADADDDDQSADEPDEAPAAEEADQTPVAASVDAAEPATDGALDAAATAERDDAVTRETAVAPPADAVATDEATPGEATSDGATPGEVSSREEAADETRALPTVAAAARAQAVSVHKRDTTRDDATTVMPPVPNAAAGAAAAATSGGVAAQAGKAASNAPVRTSAMPPRTPSPGEPAAAQQSPAQQSPAQQSPAQQSPAQQSPGQWAPQNPESAGPTAARPAASPPRSSAAPVPPALAGSSKVTAGPVPQGRRESPLDTFEEQTHVRRWPRRVLIGAVALVVLGGAYVGASYATADRVPRGTTVAGVDIGGLTEAEAVERLEQELASTLDSPVEVVAQEVQATIDPAEAGLSFDAQATVEGLTGVDLADPARLWRQVAGVAEREPVTTVDEAALDQAIESLETSLSQAPVDGSVVFVDGSAQATDAVEGWAVDAEGAADAISGSWLVAAQPIELPTTVVEPAITQAETDAALQDVAEPLVDAPISVTVEGELAVLQPADVAAAASMQPEDGALVLRLDGEALADDVIAQLPEGTLKTAADAHFGFKDDKPVLVPGRVGTTVDPEALATALATASTAQDRTAVVEVTKTDPKNTSEAMKKLGVKEVVSEFSTPLTSEPRRTINIAQGLENITGVLVRPGETFSLTDALGPLDAAHGFVEAGAIVNGEHTDAWGGGLSQVSTTTFNAAYFAGMEDVEHTPHSEWFSRYPEGREATIFTGVIDMKWKNTTPYGALLQGWVADGRAYVRIWSTKHFTVESTTSGRSGVVQPTTVYSDSSTCAPQSAGNPGFSVTVTREVFLKGELQETTSRTWRYRPQNAVVCGDPPSSDEKDEADEG